MSKNLLLNASVNGKKHNILLEEMENTKPTKLGLLMIGLFSFGFSHEYAGPIITDQKSFFPTTYHNYYENKIVGQSDYNNRIVTAPAYGKRFQDEDFFYKYERIDPRRIIPFDQLREFDYDAYRHFTQRPAKYRPDDDDDDFDFFAPQQVFKYLNDEPRYDERIKYICKNRNKFFRRPHRQWKEFDKKRSHLIEVTPGQKILPIIKEDNRYKNLYKDFGYQKYNGFDHLHDHDHDSFHGHDHNSVHDHDKDYKFINKIDKDDLKFINKIDQDSRRDRDDLKFFNRIDKYDHNSRRDRDDYKFYNRIDNDDYAKRIVIPYNLRNDRPVGASYGS